MREVDNFELFKDYLRKCGVPEKGKDYKTYYVIEVIRRGKDNKNMPSANYHFKNYYIDSIEKIDKYKDEIVTLCNLFKMRAYASVNYKDTEQVMLDTISETASRVKMHDYKKPWTIYESCSGKYFDTSNKLWVLDIDDVIDENGSVNTYKIETYKNFVNNCKPYKDKIVFELPTRSGWHIITKPFDVQYFNEQIEMHNAAAQAVGNTDHILEKHDERNTPIIKKNHLTLVYCYAGE